MSEISKEARDAAERYWNGQLNPDDALPRIIQSAIDQATAQLLSRLQASEGEVAELKKQLCVQANLFKDIEFHEARIAELEKLCQEAAERITCPNHSLTKFAWCGVCSLIARLQSAQPGSEKEGNP